MEAAYLKVSLQNRMSTFNAGCHNYAEVEVLVNPRRHEAFPPWNPSVLKVGQKSSF
jgi:hypothetical protein